MHTVSKSCLTSYQRAILTKMGLCPWRLNSKPDVASGNNPGADHLPENSVDAHESISHIEKLKQVIVESKEPQLTNDVLLAFDAKDAGIVEDVLLALNLKQHTVTHIDASALPQFSGYPLAWLEGEYLEFRDKSLITPKVEHLFRPEHKKRLWQVIQQHLSK